MVIHTCNVRAQVPEAGWPWTRLGYLHSLKRKSGCRQDMEQKQNGCRMWQNQAGHELVAFKDPEGVTQTPGEEKGINGCAQLWTLQTIILTCQTGCAIPCDKATAVTEDTKAAGWIWGLSHRKESMPSTTNLLKTPYLQRCRPREELTTGA